MELYNRLRPRWSGGQSTFDFHEENISTDNAAMKILIDAINKLQEVFSSAGLSLDKFNLPSVAVVGGQSAGKSSVLENFVGRDFLPRGSDIVTRCPLLVQLIANPEEYAEFGHLVGQKFLSFDEVKLEIERRTDELAGGKKGISDQLIILKIYSPNVVDLTLLDLPGLTKVPVGEQPPDIGHKIKKLILKYISNENTLILAVSPANNDIANSDALQLAKEVDPEGKRTIGVITKLDLMDIGTDARNILKNLVYPLEKGFIGVINRSQMDINNNKDIKEAQKSEMDFIRNHKAYRDMANKMGTEYLQQMLGKSLAQHILKKLPDLRENLKKQKEETQKHLDTFPNYDGSETMARRIVHHLLYTFSCDSDKLINGNSLDHELSTGALIIQCFRRQFPEILAKEHRAFKQQELQYLLANIRGLRYGQYVPEEAIEACIQKISENYKEPSNHCIEKIEDLLREMIANQCQNIRFPKLEEKVRDLCFEKLLYYVDKTKTMVKTFIDSQGSFMNTLHPDFRPASSIEDIPMEYYTTIQHSETKKSKVASATFFPSVFVKAREKNTVIAESSVSIRKGKEVFDGYYLRLSSHYLAFYLVEESLYKFRRKMKIANINLEDRGRPDELRLTTSGKLLPMGYKEIDLVFKSSSEKQDWLKIFCGIEVGVSENDDTQEHLEVIAYMVDTYITIIHKAIVDILPKFIKHELIDKLIDYIKKDLTIDLEDQHCELLELSPADAERKAELEAIFKATEKALITLNNLSSEFQKLK